MLGLSECRVSKVCFERLKAKIGGNEFFSF